MKYIFKDSTNLNQIKSYLETQQKSRITHLTRELELAGFEQSLALNLIISSVTSLILINPVQCSTINKESIQDLLAQTSTTLYQAELSNDWSSKLQHSEQFFGSFKELLLATFDFALTSNFFVELEDSDYNREVAISSLNTSSPRRRRHGSSQSLGGRTQYSSTSSLQELASSGRNTPHEMFRDNRVDCCEHERVITECEKLKRDVEQFCIQVTELQDELNQGIAREGKLKQEVEDLEDNHNKLVSEIEDLRGENQVLINNAEQGKMEFQDIREKLQVQEVLNLELTKNLQATVPLSPFVQDLIQSNQRLSILIATQSAELKGYDSTIKALNSTLQEAIDNGLLAPIHDVKANLPPCIPSSEDPSLLVSQHCTTKKSHRDNVFDYEKKSKHIEKTGSKVIIDEKDIKKRHRYEKDRYTRRCSDSEESELDLPSSTDSDNESSTSSRGKRYVTKGAPAARIKAAPVKAPFNIW